LNDKPFTLFPKARATAIFEMLCTFGASRRLQTAEISSEFSIRESSAQSVLQMPKSLT